MVDLIQRHIVAEIDLDSWVEKEAEIEEGRTILRALEARWSEVEEFLS